MMNFDFKRINKPVWAIISLSEDIEQKQDDLGTYYTSKDSMGLLEFDNPEDAKKYFDELEEKEAKKTLGYKVIATNLQV